MTTEPFISPYLRRPLRSYEQALRDRERARTAIAKAPPYQESGRQPAADGMADSTRPDREA